MTLEGFLTVVHHYRNTTMDTVHCLRYVLYTRRFGSRLFSRFQAIGCHYTQTFFSILLLTTAGIESDDSTPVD